MTDERFIVLVRNETDGRWDVFPANPDGPRCSVFKELTNARYQLNMLREKFPDREFRGGTVIVEEGWD